MWIETLGVGRQPGIITRGVSQREPFRNKHIHALRGFAQALTCAILIKQIVGKQWLSVRGPSDGRCVCVLI